jgi:hypothetical protein
LHPKSETPDQASTAPRQLIIEWATQLYQQIAGRAQPDEAMPPRLGGPQPSSALALLPREEAHHLSRRPAAARRPSWVQTNGSSTCGSAKLSGRH